MKIGIYDIDTKKQKHGHEILGQFPNIACGKIYGFHKQRGDEIIYPYTGEKVDKLYISTIYSSTKPHIDKMMDFYKERASEVIIGGTGWNIKDKLPAEVESVEHRYTYELYEINYGIGFTSRGCHCGCPFCVVPRKEGNKEYRVAHIEEIINPKSNHIVLLNNNSFADPGFFEDIEDIKRYGLTVNWNQANDITLVTDRIAEALSTIEYRNFAGTSPMLHFAFDQLVKRKRDPLSGKMVEFDMLEVVPEKIRILKESGIPARHLTFYMLIGYDTTLEEDMMRFNLLNNLDCNVFAMVYKNPNGICGVDGKGEPQGVYVKPLRDWINGYAFRNVNFNDFDRYTRALKSTDQISIF